MVDYCCVSSSSWEPMSLPLYIIMGEIISQIRIAMRMDIRAYLNRFRNAWLIPTLDIN